MKQRSASFLLQVVFLDTPGLVDQEDAARFSLERSLLLDPEEACRSADLLLVLQDVSNRYTREAINTKVGLAIPIWLLTQLTSRC